MILLPRAGTGWRYRDGMPQNAEATESRWDAMRAAERVARDRSAELFGVIAAAAKDGGRRPDVERAIATLLQIDADYAHELLDLPISRLLAPGELA